VALVALLACIPSPAAADWLFVPFVGSTLAADSTDVLSADPLSRHITLGGSGAWLSDGLFGVEADFAYVPGFFDTERTTGPADLQGPLTQGSVFTLQGSVILALPLSVTREGLRPYVVGGLGLIHGGPDGIGPNLSAFLSGDRDFLGMNLGGGAIGFITRRSGVRFELRHYRSLAREGDLFNRDPRSRVSFLRATVGVVVRY
jgi:hypothetical protein